MLRKKKVSSRKRLLRITQKYTVDLDSHAQKGEKCHKNTMTLVFPQSTVLLLSRAHLRFYWCTIILYVLI